MNKEMLDLFCYFVTERERVLRRREAGSPKPWTNDTILQHHHFCNNRREDDRGTKEIRKIILEQVPDLNRLPCMYTMARMFNHAPTVSQWLENGMAGVKHDRDNGGKIFNTAYVVSTCGESMDKVDYVARVMYEVAKVDVPRTSLREGFDALRTVNGLGSFLAGQVIADLKNDRYYDKTTTPDWYTFSVMGPGSKKMLDHIFGGGTTERNYEARIDLLDKVTEGKIPKCHRQDLQNQLCEGAKFVKYKLGLGGRVRRYNAHL